MLKYVALVFSFALVNKIFSTKHDHDGGEGSDIFVCENGLLYHINQCNLCMCANTSIFPCNMHKCKGADHAARENCAENREWKEDCNDCKCVLGVGTVCSVKECPPPKQRPGDGYYDYPLVIDNSVHPTVSTKPAPEYYDYETNSAENSDYT